MSGELFLEHRTLGTHTFQPVVATKGRCKNRREVRATSYRFGTLMTLQACGGP